MYRCTIKGTCSGVDVDNVLGFISDLESDHSGLVSVLSVIAADWGAYMMRHLSTEYVLSELIMRSLTDPTSGATIGDTSSGATSVALLPLFACAKVNWLTPFVGRSFRGRTGLVGLGEGDTGSTDPNNLSASALTNLQTDVTDFRTHLATDLAGVGNNWKLAVVSTTAGGAARVPPIGTPVTGGVVGTALGTRRSRLT